MNQGSQGLGISESRSMRVSSGVAVTRFQHYQGAMLQDALCSGMTLGCHLTALSGQHSASKIWCQYSNTTHTDTAPLPHGQSAIYQFSHRQQPHNGYLISKYEQCMVLNG